MPQPRRQPPPSSFRAHLGSCTCSLLILELATPGTVEAGKQLHQLECYLRQARRLHELARDRRPGAPAASLDPDDAQGRRRFGRRSS